MDPRDGVAMPGPSQWFWVLSLGGLLCRSWWRTWGSGPRAPEAPAAQHGLDGAVVWDVGVLPLESLKAKNLMATPIRVHRHTHEHTHTCTHA